MFGEKIHTLEITVINTITRHSFSGNNKEWNQHLNILSAINEKKKKINEKIPIHVKRIFFIPFSSQSTIELNYDDFYIRNGIIAYTINFADVISIKLLQDGKISNNLKTIYGKIIHLIQNTLQNMAIDMNLIPDNQKKALKLDEIYHNEKFIEINKNSKQLIN